jgi:hypothetical protein
MQRRARVQRGKPPKGEAYIFFICSYKRKEFRLRAKQDLFLARDRGVRGEYPEPKP